MTPLVDPGTDLEDERPTPVGSPVAAKDEGMPLSPTLAADVEVERALLEVGVLPAMVTHIVDPAVGFSLSPATYSVPPVPVMSVGDSIPPEVAAPDGLAVGSPARREIPLRTGTGVPLEYFPAVGTFRRVYHAPGPPDTESDGGG